MKSGKAKKSSKPKKAPKVPKYNMDKNKMKEYDKSDTRKSPMAPMRKKRLSK
jgi:hypothetical protein